MYEYSPGSGSRIPTEVARQPGPLIPIHPAHPTHPTNPTHLSQIASGQSYGVPKGYNSRPSRPPIRDAYNYELHHGLGRFQPASTPHGSRGGAESVPSYASKVKDTRRSEYVVHESSYFSTDRT